MTSWVDPDEQALADHLLRGVPGLRECCAIEACSTSSTWPGPLVPLRVSPDGAPLAPRREPSAGNGERSAAGWPPSGSGHFDREGTWPLGLVLDALAELVASTASGRRPALFRVVAPLLEQAAGAPETEDAIRYGLLQRLPEPDCALLAEAAEPALWASIRALAGDTEPSAGASPALGGA